ncbi:MAG: alpha/beta hydrolase [Chitinispirillaceae bacterium]|nr:alpha/beta hydrolase [Chitinispirillaceae bacterium]
MESKEPDTVRAGDVLLLKLLLPVILLSLSGCSFIVSKLTFFPDRVHTIPSDSFPPHIRRVPVISGKRVELSCVYLQPNNTKKIVLYFHGNASNIDQCLPELAGFCRAGMNAFGVEYRGYGESSGFPTEKGIYRDAAAALRYVIDTLKYPVDSIFICGRSIGSAPAVEIAQNLRCAGVILITPMTSGNDMGRKMGIGFLTPFMGNPFDNIGKCVNITAPVLILHGTDDETAPFSMGMKLYGKLNGKKTLVKIERGHHNDLEMVDSVKYWGAILNFVEMKN